MKFENKNVLISGGTGMIGRHLVEMLLNKNCKTITIASLDEPNNLPENVLFRKVDLTSLENCLEVCKGQDIVLHLAGIKGSPLMAKTKPASFMVPMIMFNTNLLEAARRRDAEWILYTSSIGVYAQAPTLHEDDVWKIFPSENDKFAGWAKRIGELQLEAYNVQYDMKNTSIIRPANVYGKWDNFDPNTAMVIPSLINRIVSGENPLRVWGNGSAVRDFIHANDVARAVVYAVENEINLPVNVGSGEGVTIKELVEIICRAYKEITGKTIDIEWDTTKPTGDKQRLMDTERLKGTGFNLETSLEQGVKETMTWFIANQYMFKQQNNYFAK